MSYGHPSFGKPYFSFHSYDQSQLISHIRPSTSYATPIGQPYAHGSSIHGTTCPPTITLYVAPQEKQPYYFVTIPQLGSPPQLQASIPPPPTNPP